MVINKKSLAFQGNIYERINARAKQKTNLSAEWKTLNKKQKRQARRLRGFRNAVQRVRNTIFDENNQRELGKRSVINGLKLQLKKGEITKKEFQDLKKNSKKSLFFGFLKTFWGTHEFVSYNAVCGSYCRARNSQNLLGCLFQKKSLS